jgi:hypothetical protein
MGYWVRDCAAMNYKSDFRPCELLGPDGVWRAPADASTNPTPGADAASATTVSSRPRNENCPAPAVEMP